MVDVHPIELQASLPSHRPLLDQSDRVLGTDQHVVDFDQLHGATKLGEEPSVVLQESSLAEEVASQGIPALHMNDDVFRPEGGSCFPVLALEGLHVSLQDLSVGARSSHHVLLLLRYGVQRIVAGGYVGRTSQNTPSTHLGE